MFPQYKYLVTLATGNVEHAGTDAKVKITLIGNFKQTHHTLLDTEKSDLERGQNNQFTFLSDYNIGEIIKIRISHDNRGSNPGWYFHIINIREQFGSRLGYSFTSSRWLIKDELDGKTDVYFIR